MPPKNRALTNPWTGKTVHPDTPIDVIAHDAVCEVDVGIVHDREANRDIIALKVTLNDGTYYMQVEPEQALSLIRDLATATDKYLDMQKAGD